MILPASQPGPSAVERQPAGPAAGKESPREPSARPPSRVWLYAAVGLVVVWGLVLVGLIVFTANPVTLNRTQIAASDRVVTARLDGEDRLRIEKDWTAGPSSPAFPEMLPVRNLAATGMEPGRPYIVPLRHGADWWEVTPSPLPTDRPDVGRPLVYPATAEATGQLEAILTNPAAPPR